METGEEQARKSLSMHPLWEKYLFPGSKDPDDCFYYNPYSGASHLSASTERPAEPALTSSTSRRRALARLPQGVDALPRRHPRRRDGSRQDDHGRLAVRPPLPLLRPADSARPDDERDRSCSIHTNTAWNAQPPVDDVDGAGAVDGVDSDDSDDQHEAVKPSRTQARLGAIFSKKPPTSSSSATATTATKGKRAKLKAGTPRATLVVAPMTLLSQWCDELERSSKGRKMRVVMYYGNKRESGSDLLRDIDEGVDVVVTRCVRLSLLPPLSSLLQPDRPLTHLSRRLAATVLCARTSSRAGSTCRTRRPRRARATTPSPARRRARARTPRARAATRRRSRSSRVCTPSSGSVSVRAFPLVVRRRPRRRALTPPLPDAVLDEAHLIKSRTTLNAKASYALRGARRWALTGTPIVKCVLLALAPSPPPRVGPSHVGRSPAAASRTSTRSCTTSSSSHGVRPLLLPPPSDFQLTVRARARRQLLVLQDVRHRPLPEQGPSRHRGHPGHPREHLCIAVVHLARPLVRRSR